jgi:hypothetical protein
LHWFVAEACTDAALLSVPCSHHPMQSIKPYPNTTLSCALFKTGSLVGTWPCVDYQGQSVWLMPSRRRLAAFVRSDHMRDSPLHARASTVGPSCILLVKQACWLCYFNSRGPGTACEHSRVLVFRDREIQSCLALEIGTPRRMHCTTPFLRSVANGMHMGLEAWIT